MTPKSAGRKGSMWRRLRAQTLAKSTTCVLCGHDGADSVHHIIARAVALAAGRDDLVTDPANLAPAHHQPCPVCGIRCNTSHGTGQPRRKPRPSRAW